MHNSDLKTRSPAVWEDGGAKSLAVLNNQNCTTAKTLVQERSDRLVSIVVENSREGSELHLRDFSVSCRQLALTLSIAIAAVLAEHALHAEAPR